MLSILIPTYNYNVLELVKSAHEQCTKAAIEFEILVFDDCSPEPPKENEAINSLTASTYKKLPKNIGRSAIRNLLGKTAKYDNLLFLDADTQIVLPNFIANYISAITPKTQIIYGGIKYQKSKPEKEKVLRWIYGNEREALPVETRLKEPHLRFLTLNFLIKKNVFSIVSFNEEIPNLRHEDTLFALNTKNNNIQVEHIDNYVIHLGLESSKVFLKKSRESVEALLLFVEQQLINPNETALSRVATKVTKYHLAPLVLISYNLFKSLFEKNLLSNNPSMRIFDIYRLGYYISLQKRKTS